MNYGMGKVVSYSFDEARERVEKELEKDGFGILTEIDVKATMKKKLDVDFKRYNILGACNPPFAYQALQNEEELGLLMPCNVIVYENDKGETVVSAINIEIAMGAMLPHLAELAKDVGAKLQAVIDRL